MIKYILVINMIEKVEVLGFLTGKNSKNNTLSKYKVGGTDLGYPIYNSVTNEMFLAFGDTFSDPFGSDKPKLNFKRRWRSNVLAKIKLDKSYENGIEILDFLKNKKTNIAKSIVQGHHTADGDNIEVTKIPTGLIEVNGIIYMFYFSIRRWKPFAIMNYGGCLKSSDNGKTWSRVYDLTWVDETTREFDENIEKLINEPVSNTPHKLKFVNSKKKIDVNVHKGHFYTLIFPVDGYDGYIYLFGECGYRKRGIKLARVLKENIEKFDEYEYMVDTNESGNPIWVKGRKGLDLQKRNVNSYLITNPSGELSVVYNKYLNKWLLFKMSEDAYQVLCYVSDNVYGPYGRPIEIIKNTDSRLPNDIIYAPLTHEKLFEEDGKIMNMLLSLWLPNYNPVILRIYLK